MNKATDKPRRIRVDPNKPKAKKPRHRGRPAKRRRKVTTEQVTEMRRLRFDEEWSLPKLARKFGITESYVSYIVRGKAYVEVPMKPEWEDGRKKVPKTRKPKTPPTSSRPPGNYRFTDEEVLEMRRRHFDNGESYSDVARSVGGRPSHIRIIIIGKAYKHLPLTEEQQQALKNRGDTVPVTSKDPSYRYQLVYQVDGESVVYYSTADDLKAAKREALAELGEHELLTWHLECV